MSTWKCVDGAGFTRAGFDQYRHLLHWLAWRPSFVVLHNTSAPTLADRPEGLTKEHILGLERYYRDEQHWSAGSHLFVDDRQIWVFTPLTVSGVHSPSWNKLALSVEMLGEYQTEAFNSGRGLRCTPTPWRPWPPFRPCCASTPPPCACTRKTRSPPTKPARAGTSTKPHLPSMCRPCW